MPSCGNGPMPKISSGLKPMSSTTESSRKRNGVRESPTPRSAELRNAKAYSVGIARKMMRRYASASGRDSAGVPIAASNGCDSHQPATAITTDRPMKNVALVPMTRRACGRSRAPIDWPIRIEAAMPMPNTEPIRKNMMLLAFAVAVSAASPRKRPTQIAFTEPFIDWAMLPARMGRANRNRLRPIGPVVRSSGALAMCAGDHAQRAAH